MLPQPAPPARIEAPAPLAAKGRALAFLAGGAAADGKALLAELRAALVAAERRPGRLHPATLTLRALAGLVLDRQGEARGLRIFAEACGALQRQRLLLQRQHGAEAREALPHLEALKELYGLERLNADRWEDLVLRIALRHSRGPRPDLETRLVAAIERHYGPFLSFRPPDREAVLEDVAMLLDLWSRRTDRVQRTHAFVEVGLRSDAAGVWKLVAAQAGDSLRERLKFVIAALDPGVLLEDPRGFLAWLPNQVSAPWAAAARTLAGAVDKAIQESDLPPVGRLMRRVRLARALGEGDRAARLVVDALAAPGGDRVALLALAQEQLEAEPSALLRQELREAFRREGSALLVQRGNQELVVQEARRLDEEGEYLEAEGWWRRMLDGAGFLAPEAAQEALACNLAAQGRWEEARALLEPLAAKEKWRGDPALRFRLAVGEAGTGDRGAALRWAREGLALLPAEGPLEPVPGLAATLRLLGDEPQGIAFLARARATLDPEARIPALAEPAALLRLLEGLETRGVKPQPASTTACGGPWTLLEGDAAAKGMALLQAAGGRRQEDAEPCLREALRSLEQAWGEQDPRLATPLLRLARCLQERTDPEAEPVYRRILDLAGSHPELDPALDAEARARLGQLLAEQGRDEEADALLRAALDRLAARPSAEPNVREMTEGVLLLLIARLEHREDYAGALEALERAAGGLSGPRTELEGGWRSDPAKSVRELEESRARLARLVHLQALLRAQGLP